MDSSGGKRREGGKIGKRYIHRSSAEGLSEPKVWKNIGMEEKDKDGKLITLDDPKFDPVFEFWIVSWASRTFSILDLVLV